MMCCYSTKLKAFLLKKGLTFEAVGLHPQSMNKFWVFIRTPELYAALGEWAKFDKAEIYGHARQQGNVPVAPADGACAEEQKAEDAQ